MGDVVNMLLSLMAVLLSVTLKETTLVVVIGLGGGESVVTQLSIVLVRTV